MAVKIAGRYRGRVTAWTRRSLTLGAALALALIGPLASGRGPGLGEARADGIMLIEAGAFWMGSDSAVPDEGPMHRVYVRDFCRSPEGMRYFDEDDPDARIHRRDGGFIADPGFEEHPAVEVSWFGARDYCLWLGRRLPTEAEWEKAARGLDRRRYPWGDEAPDAERAIVGRPYNATERGDLRLAGAGPTGVQDLLGNLREWTGSAYRPYPYRADDGREHAPLDAGRVVRGASHDDPVDALRVTIRRLSSYDEGHGGLAHGHHHIGFRCATSEDLGGR
jgi:formylglycine-generating enzyme required for sulfatase activity